MMPSSKSFARRDKVAISVISVFIFAIAVLRYSGIPDQYTVLYAFFQNPDHFPNDIYLNNTFFFESSYYFVINAILGLHKNGLVSISWYLATTAVAVYVAYQIISRHFGFTKHLDVFFILLFVSVLNHNFPVTAWGGIIPQGPGTSNMFAKALGLMAVYAMLENKIWLSAVITTVTISLHILGDFILVPILFFFIVFNKETPNRTLAALILPVAFVLFKALSTNVGISSGQDTEQTYEAVMAMGGQDGDFLEQSKLALVLFGASFFVFPILWRRLGATDTAHQNLRPFLKAVYVASLLVAISATFYTAFGYRLFLFPPVIMLGPIRAMNYYTLFLYLCAFVLIFRTTKLTSIEKVSALLALVLLHGESLGGVLYPAVVLFGGMAVSRFSGDLLSPLKGRAALAPLGLALLMTLTTAQIVKGGVYYTSFNALGWQHLKHWTRTIDGDEGVWAAYKKIRNMKADFVMLPFYRTRGGRLVGHNTYLNIFAEKSHFISDGHHFYFKAKLWQEHKVRMKTTDDVTASIKSGRPLSEATRGVLESRNVTIVVPGPDGASLTGWTEKTVVDGFHLLRYSD